MRYFSLSASVLLVIVAVRVAKPQAAPTSIPVPLVSALLDDPEYPTPASPKYSVGSLPLGYPRVLAPTGPVTIVGGMTRGDETIAVFADSTRRLATVMEQLFEQHGYTRPPPTPGLGFSSGYSPDSYFCGDSGTVSVVPLAGVNRVSVRVTYYRMHGSESCRNDQPTRQPAQLTLPELKPPPGVIVSESGGGGGSDGVNSKAEVTGPDLSAATIVAHYAAQLVSAGWTAEMPAVSQRVVAQYFTAKDASGGSWGGVLMASGSKRALSLSITMQRQGSR